VNTEEEIKMDFDKKTEERIKEFVKVRNEALFSLDEKKNPKVYEEIYRTYTAQERNSFLGNGLQGYMQYRRRTARG